MFCWLFAKFVYLPVSSRLCKLSAQFRWNDYVVGFFQEIKFGIWNRHHAPPHLSLIRWIWNLREIQFGNLEFEFEIKFRKFGIGQAQNLNCEARSVHLPDDRDRRGQGRREGDPARMVSESAAWAKLRALEEGILDACNAGEKFRNADPCRMARHTSVVTFSGLWKFIEIYEKKSATFGQNSGKLCENSGNNYKKISNVFDKKWD